MGTATRKRRIILIADGDPAYARDLKQALLKEGMPARDIVIFGDGDQIVRYLGGKGPRPAVILVDAWLPKRPGLDVLTWIRNSARSCRLPVLVSSLGEDRPLMKRAYEGGANAFLLKPFGGQAIRRTMQAVRAFWLGVNRAAS